MFKVIGYEYDAVGNLSKLIYPDNTAVTYSYDANHNLTRVTDWANRVTAYAYDANNRVTGVTKPNGSVITTLYDNQQRVISTVEKTSAGAVISGFEYTYDNLSNIVEEKVLAKNEKMCYTYDELNRVIKRTVKNLNNEILSEETFTHDAAGNVTDAPDSCFGYDTNNRLTVFNGNSVSHKMNQKNKIFKTRGRRFLRPHSLHRLLCEGQTILIRTVFVRFILYTVRAAAVNRKESKNGRRLHYSGAS